MSKLYLPALFGRVSVIFALLIVGLLIGPQGESLAKPLSVVTVNGIKNGNFELGNNGNWSITNNQPQYAVITTSHPTGVTPRSGSWITWLGGVYNNTKKISQTVPVPPEATSVTIVYYYWQASAETTCFLGGDTFSFGYAYSGASSGATSWPCQSSNTNGWQRVQINLGDINSSWVSLSFELSTNGTANTNVFIDDVQVIIGGVNEPTLTVSPGTLNFRSEGGSVPAGQNLVISKSGYPAMSWTATKNVSWITLSKTSGTFGQGNSSSDTIQVTVNPLNQSIGTHTGQIVVSSPTGQGSPKTINVTLTIQPTILQVSTSSLTFSAVAGGSNPPAQSFIIGNGAGGTLSWTASDNMTWLTLNRTSGSAPPTATVTASVNISSLGAGNYAGQITITSPGAQGSPKTISVSLTVQPVLQVSPSSLTFSAEDGSSNPPAQSFTIGGNGPFNWTASENIAWLTLNRVSGGVPPNTGVSAAVDISNLDAGNYSGQITITSPGAQGSPKMINVSLNLLPGSTDVGVIAGSTGCQKGLERIHIRMDDEDDNNNSSKSGWTGGFSQDSRGNTTLTFCRVDGSEFKHWVASSDSDPTESYGYAVLKLGDTCPNGSKNFSRYFDNQNDRKEYRLGIPPYKIIENINHSIGNLYPSVVAKDTTLQLCFFEGRVGSSIETMDRFPEFRFEYGVLAHSSFSGALETGQVITDDENHDNKNSFNVSLNISSEEQSTISNIIWNFNQDNSRSNTRINLAKVYTPPPDTDYALCPKKEKNESGYCEKNPRPIDLSISLYTTKQLRYTTAISHFADAIYEMSNGVHKVRDVYVYQERKNSASADVVWEASGRAYNGGPPGGYYYWGDSIAMFDEGTPIVEGYTLGHEWGHYFYGLMDEYRELDPTLCEENAKDDHSPWCDDDAVSPSVMHNQYMATSGTPYLNWLNFSVEKNNTKKNAQDRVYNASGWVTLERPFTEDPRDAFLEERGSLCIFPPDNENFDKFNRCSNPTFVSTRSRRYYYPELMSHIDPANDNLPRIDLTKPSAAPRSLLNIIWWGDTKPSKSPLTLLDGDGYAETSPFRKPFYVDPSIEDIEVTIIYGDGNTNSGDVTLILRKPNGQIGGTVNCPAANQKVEACSIELLQPESGEWTLEVQITNPPQIIDYQVIGKTPNDSGQEIRAIVGPAYGSVVAYPNPVILIAKVERELPIAKANLTAQARTPGGEIINLNLKDDGLPPDALANDGRYISFLPYNQNGDYQITATFDNGSGNAEFTAVGSPHHQPSYPVGENFQRAASTVVTIVDYAADDHGNTPNDATPLDPDNTDQPGQIDSPNDCDFFKVVPTETGQLVVRIVGLALGMEPQVQILDEDGVTVLAEMTFDPAQEDYMFVVLDVVAGKPFYVRVCHLDPNADTGLYFISVGPPLDSETEDDTPGGGGTGSQAIYLPMIIRE